MLIESGLEQPVAVHPRDVVHRYVHDAVFHPDSAVIVRRGLGSRVIQDLEILERNRAGQRPRRSVIPDPGRYGLSLGKSHKSLFSKQMRKQRSGEDHDEGNVKQQRPRTLGGPGNDEA